MGECGPSFQIVVVDACTGEPIPNAMVGWHRLVDYTYPWGAVVDCGTMTYVVESADGAGAKTIDDLIVSNGITQYRVSVFTPSGVDFNDPAYRSGQHYLDITTPQPITLSAYPNGNCPPQTDPENTGGGSAGACSNCGQLTVIQGPRSTWPNGVQKPEGWKGMGHEPAGDRCTTSTARYVPFDGVCFPGVQFLEAWDAAGVFGAAGTAPIDWNEPQAVAAAGAATADMVYRLMQNQAYMSTQLTYLMVMAERQAVWSNQMNEAVNTRLMFLNELVQLLGTALHGEGWCDRTHVDRNDPYAAAHPIIL